MNFFTDVIQRDPRYRTRATVRDMDLLEPGFREKVERLMRDALAEEDTQLTVVETYRSRERQEQVFRQGASKLRTVGTHHYGLAVDFAKKVGTRVTWDGSWKFMPRLALRYGLTSLYPNDAGHIQGCTIPQQRDLFAGRWYPGTQIGVGSVAPVPVNLSVPLPPPVPADLPARQREALVVASSVNLEYYRGWFLHSSMMAFMEVESSFDPAAYRREPDGRESRGLWQVLDDTARWLGHRGPEEDLFDPSVCSYYGMKYAAWGWNYLLGHFERPPTLAEWAGGYNAGYGAIAKGRKNTPYTDKWLAARERWGKLDHPAT